MSEEKLRAVLDTQLFLRAAINLKSLPAKIIFDWRERYQLVASIAIQLEVKDVLYRPKIRRKFPHLNDEIAEKVLFLFSEATIVHPVEVPPISRDPKDDIFLACAKTAVAHCIVTEDQDLIVLNPYDEIRIINAFDFMTLLKKRDE